MTCFQQKGWSFVLSVVFCAFLAAATPIAQQGVHHRETAKRQLFGFGGPPMPIVKLPSGSYQATHYDKERDVYTFSNIRFAKNPVGPLRFAKPVKPDPETKVMSNGADIACKQAVPNNGLNFLGSYGNSTLGGAVSPAVLNIAISAFGNTTPQTEDCLFLDIYVPGKAIAQPNARLPVVNWIYGGGYTTGWKSMLGMFTGVNFIELAEGNLIWVAGNYRLGSYGWMAGPTVEKGATANAGLWDQRAVLEWIQDNIKFFGGDKDQVTAWGESAGAGSVFNHLVAEGGKSAPLFKRAAILSPYQPLGDRFTKATQEKNYKKIEALVGCTDKGFACVQNVPTKIFDEAQQKFQTETPAGVFGTGNEVDGNWAVDLPSTSFKKGMVVPIESIILSTTADEGSPFTDNSIKNDTQFDQWVNTLYGPLAKTQVFQKSVREMYPPVGKGDGLYKDQIARRKAFYRDGAFSCYARYITEAYPDKVWNMQFGELGGFHGTDLIALYSRRDFTILGIPTPLPASLRAVSRAYQSYLVSHAVTGNPNTLSLKTANRIPGKDNVAAPMWMKTPRLQGEWMDNVMFMGNGSLVSGSSNNINARNCDMWQTMMQEATAEVGR